MKAEKFVHLEALGNERLSTILFSLGRHDLSNCYLEEALRLYRDEWGAIAKCEWLLSSNRVCVLTRVMTRN
jgi:GAF domain-containing protein